ncbi:MAG: TIGR00282 family metallophosphoesterase [Faecalibacterium sp.]|nr:TIGR00282 family metallophosphoesterase [Ruminococcus sp.]MCM1391162.1 TIGR00282 family metallophosphoesterase [Ruminococcus sp.]MCM1486124.1 TIGR00282 family metallophosphoesterase [Faecalibacterium sp.]
MNILVLGDVVSSSGCRFVRQKLTALKKLKHIDLCIANGENSAKGNGITPDSANYLFASGVDFITGGNHSFRRSEVYPLLDERDDVIRPYNFPLAAPGKGVGIIDMGRTRVAVINLMGTMYMEALANPFYACEQALKETDGCKIVLVDFHAEATSEKKALGFYLDGKVSAFFGTHTHVQTADECILPGGTGYITDLGMCGTYDSVLGVDKNIVINKFRTNLPARFDTADDLECMINGCIFEIDEKSGKCVDVERVSIR